MKGNLKRFTYMKPTLTTLHSGSTVVRLVLQKRRDLLRRGRRLLTMRRRRTAHNKTTSCVRALKKGYPHHRLLLLRLPKRPLGGHHLWRTSLKAAVGAASALEAFDDHTILLLLVHRIMLLAVPTAPLNASCTETPLLRRIEDWLTKKTFLFLTLFQKLLTK